MRHPRRSSPNEASPLLGSINETPRDRIVNLLHPEIQKTQKSHLLLAFSIFCIAGAGRLADIPTTQLLENVLCQKHYGSFQDGHEDISDQRCKAESIQSELSWLQGAISSLESLVGLAVSLPYGILADRIGRRPVLAVSSLGTILSLTWTIVVLRFCRQMPVWLMLLSPLLQVLGGGESVLLAMMYSIVADTVSASSRSNAFLRMAVASFIGQSAGTLCSASLMQVGFLWTTLLLGFILIPLGTSVIVFIPETLNVTEGSGRNIRGNDMSSRPRNGSPFSKGCYYAKKYISHCGNVISVINSRSAILILFSFILAAAVSRGVGNLLVQYMSKQHGWSFAKAGYLISIRGVGDMVVCLIILPALEKLMLSSKMPFRFTPARKDLVLARASVVLLTIGTLLMGGRTVPVVLTGLCVVTLGNGWVALCRSLILSFTDAAHVSRLYTLISMLETVGGMAAGPVLAWLFSMAMKTGGDWKGLPYIALSAACALAAVQLCFVKLPPELRRSGFEEDE